MTFILPSTRSPFAYFALTFALSIPFWVAGALCHLQLLPDIPVSALGLSSMAGAASILVFCESGSAGVAALWKRAFDLHRVSARSWYVPTLALMPAILALSWVVMRLGGVPVPAPVLSIGGTLALFVVLFVAAVGEELGWSGYAIDPLRERLGALRAALVIGVVWAVWHVVPLLQAHRSVGFIAWWSLGTVALRVLLVWLYENTGRSVFVVVLAHTMWNLAWQLFPIDGSWYDPRVTSPITAAMAVWVVLRGGPSLRGGLADCHRQVAR